MTAKRIGELAFGLWSWLAWRCRGRTLHRHVQEAEQRLFRLAVLLGSHLLRLGVHRVVHERISFHRTPLAMFGRTA